MSRFLKLTTKIINKDVIQHIDINKDKFIIHLKANKIDGALMFGGGYIRSFNSEFAVCKTKNSIDYKIVSDWIDNELK